MLATLSGRAPRGDQVTNSIGSAGVLFGSIATDWTPGAIERVKGQPGRNGRRVLVVGATVIVALLIIRGVIQYSGS